MTHFLFPPHKQTLAVFACGLAVLLPLRADDSASENKSTPLAVASTDALPEPGMMASATTATASSPEVSATPTLVPSAPGLRPVEMPDGSLASASPDSNPTPDSNATPTPSPTEVASTSTTLTPPPMPTPDPSAPAPAPSAASPSPNAMVNLVNLLVAQKVITKDAGDTLIKQADQEAASAQAAVAKAGAAQAAPASTPPADDDTVHVAYVPDVVKNQIRDEVKADVMKQAKDEHWAGADTTPDWVHRFHVTGDIRTRYEGDLFPDGNSPGQLVNFNSINTGSPFDINPLTQKSGLIPTYNVDENRNRFRLRARIGAGIDLGENFYAGMRIGTGSDDSPVSENQTLGSASGQGGNFSKYQIWLDRGFIRYEIGGQQDKDFSVTFGRFDNPFFNTNMLWADDLAFDGFMAQGKYQVADGVTPFAVAGAFPVFNTDLNFGTNSTVAGNGYESSDKWLFAGQTGATWIINKDFTFKGAVGYFDFENIQGQVSSPVSQDVFSSLGTNFNGDTDDSRPSFAQHGNTYIALRNIVPDAALGGSIPEYQYFGLASRFQELTITGQLDYSHFDPFHIWLIGEFVDNVAFDKSGIEGEGPSVLPGPLNNNNGDSYAGGGQGYDIRLNLGAPSLAKLWDWNVNLTYRYLESDAVVDAFNDSDFGGYLAGTNLKGFIVGGNLALSSRVWTSLRFLEADSIAGPPLKTDTIQVDLNAKF